MFALRRDILRIEMNQELTKEQRVLIPRTFVYGFILGVVWYWLIFAGVETKHNNIAIKFGVAEYYVGEDNKLKFRYLTDKRDLE